MGIQLYSGAAFTSAMDAHVNAGLFMFLSSALDPVILAHVVGWLSEYPLHNYLLVLHNYLLVLCVLCRDMTGVIGVFFRLTLITKLYGDVIMMMEELVQNQKVCVMKRSLPIVT